MKKAILAIISILLLATIAFAATQNLLTYTETDPNNRVVIAQNRVTVTGMVDADGSTYTSKDLGVGAITEATSLSVILLNNGSSNLLSLCNYSIWTQANDSYQGLVGAGKKFFLIRQGRTASGYYSAIIYNAAVSDIGFYAANTARLHVTTRSGNIYTTIVYSGTTTASGVLDTLVVNAGETPPDFQWHIIASNNDDGVGVAAQSGYAELYSFSGLAGTSPITHLGYPQMVF